MLGHARFQLEMMLNRFTLGQQRVVESPHATTASVAELDARSPASYPKSSADRPSVWGQRLERLAIAALGVLVILFVLTQGLFVDRPAGVEEIVTYNAAHMFFETGHVSFPAFAFWYGPRIFETMGVHPHTQYALIGTILKLGTGMRLAETVPVALMSTIVVLLTVTSRLSAGIKIGVLFGLGAAIAVTVDSLSDHVVGVRPEFHAACAWLAGLVALAAARAANWNIPRLVIGAFLLTLASGLQWNGILAFTGVGVFAALAIWELRPRAALPKLAAMAVGGGLFGIPFIVLFVVPNWDLISMVREMAWAAAPLDIWQENAKVYGYFAQVFGNSAAAGQMRFTGGPVAVAFSTGLPGFVVGAALLLLVRGMRAVALASLPMPLWSFLAANYKGYYYMPEFTIVLVGFGVVVASLVLFVASRINRAWLSPLAVAGTACVAGYAIVTGSPSLPSAQFVNIPDPQEVAREAGKLMVGPSALVTSQHQLWFIAGGTYWHDYTRDIIGNFETDPHQYFSKFDVVAETPYWTYSIDALKRSPRSTAVVAMYADGSLQLRGFYSDHYAYNLYSATRSAALKGFVRRDRDLYEFDEAADGQHVFLSLVCPVERADPFTELRGGPNALATTALAVDIAAASVPLPGPGQSNTLSEGPVSKIRGLILPRSAYEASKASLTAGCQIRDEVPGQLTMVDPYGLGRQLTKQDRMVYPFWTADEAFAARAGVLNASPAGS